MSLTPHVWKSDTSCEPDTHAVLREPCSDCRCFDQLSLLLTLVFLFCQGLDWQAIWQNQYWRMPTSKSPNAWWEWLIAELPNELFMLEKDIDDLCYCGFSTLVTLRGRSNAEGKLGVVDVGWEASPQGSGSCSKNYLNELIVKSLEIPVETSMPLYLVAKCHNDSHMTVYVSVCEWLWYFVLSFCG